MNLHELQSTLQNFLLDQKESAHDVIMNNLTLATPKFSHQERLGIYHEAYRLRLVDALHNDFPALEIMLGTETFADLMDEYITENPSHHPSLRWLGEKLPSFLRAHNAWKNQTTLCELAEFEWAQIMAFDAIDESLATLEDVRALQNTQWLGLQLHFHSSLQLLHFYSNAPNVWQAIIKDEAEFETTTHSESQVWLVWRSDLQVVYREIDPSESWALQNFMAGNNFSTVCEGLCEWFAAEQVPLQAAQYLQKWLVNGLVTKIACPEL